MNFSGWVAIPRSVLNYTRMGILSNTELLVLTTLMFLADSKTGRGHINAAALRASLPDLKYETAKRALKSLEDKRLVFRQIRHASTALYPYWVHGYQITSGPHKMLWTNLSKVFSNHDVSSIEYDTDVPEAIPEITPAVIPEAVPEGALENAPNNNNDRDHEKDQDLPVTGDGASVRCIEAGIASRSTGSPDGTAPPAMALAGDDGAGCPSMSGGCQSPPVSTQSGVRYEDDEGFIDSVTGARLPESELNPRIAHLGLRLVHGSFINTETGAPVFLRHALPLITANPAERIAA